jgi:NAD(P)-dependent dehydrogenase (short-subunit alcohol dehydrogenase family)
MDFQLTGKVAIVTGSGRHIGRQIALTLAQEGAKVVVNDYFEDRAKQTADEIVAAGGEAIGIRSDVRDYNDVNAMVQKAINSYGKVDILVNNVGIPPAEVDQGAIFTPFFKTDKEAWDDEINIGLYAVLNCCRAVLEPMVNQKNGKIVNILSDAGRIGEPGQAVYSAAKAGIAGFSKALAKEVGRYCINVNCVAAGFTPPEPLLKKMVGDNMEKMLKAYPIGRGLNRVGLPSDIANAVTFLCSDASAFITGQITSVSGGYTMVD